jgi:hypothetical protein
VTKVLVFGSRSWTDRQRIRDRLGELLSGTIVVHGQSPGGGADLIADEEARALGFGVVPVPISADDRKRAQVIGRPRLAPILRNIRMLNEHPDIAYAIGFWDGKSPGSRHMRDECRLRNIPVEIVTP